MESDKEGLEAAPREGGVDAGGVEGHTSEGPPFWMLQRAMRKDELLSRTFVLKGGWGGGLEVAPRAGQLFVAR